MSYLTKEQVEVLLAPIKPHRVGKDGKNFSHVEAYELRAHLNRCFGFARWSEDVLEQQLLFETSSTADSKEKWSACFRSLVRLTVCAPDGTVLATYTEGATGDAQNQPSRADALDLALKTSASQAFKRCCTNLGDSFGLSLYAKGSLNPIVRVTLVGAEPSGEPPQDMAPPVVAEGEQTAPPPAAPSGAMPAAESTGEIPTTRTPMDVRADAMAAVGHPGATTALRALLHEANQAGWIKTQVPTPTGDGKVALATLIGNLMGSGT